MLIYVKTFFSTDVIKYQNQNDYEIPGANEATFSGSFSKIALMRWLQVTLPLTAITLLFAYLMIRYQKRLREREGDLPFHENYDSKIKLEG